VGTLRVFLSYHSPDREMARRLARALEAQAPGLDVFFDCFDLRAGAFWVPALADAISNADAVIVLLGARGPGSWQRLEYFEALDRKAKDPNFPIVPVLLPNAAARLPFLYQLQQLSLADPTASNALEPLIAALHGAPSPAPEQPWRTVNPYRGLLAMTDADADFFFGREQLTTDILERLRRGERMLALIGNSGVGKSSLAQAGVVAALRRQCWPGGDARDWPSDLRDSRSWLVLTMKPGDAPVFELARAFVTQWTEPTDPARERLSAKWANNLRETLGLAALLRATRDHFREGFGLPPPDRFVLVVDQAEELYTRAGEVEAHRFSEIVVAGLHDPTLTLLTSLRSDHYGHFQADAPLFMNSAVVDVPPLREDGLRQVVERPPTLLGAQFEDGNMGERVVGATARQPGALPLLSYLLEDLWKGMQRRADGVLRWSDYPDLVGVRGVLARRAEEFFETCREDDRAVLQRLFMLRLVHVPAEGEVTSRRARREECSAVEWRLIENLAGSDWRLLVTGVRGNEITAEVAHEVLLRDWERLSRWLEAERAFLIWKGELEADRREWQRTSADEGALLRGTRLTEAEAWLARRGADLLPEDRAFVEASVGARERARAAQTRRRRWIVGGSLTAAAVMAVLAVVSLGLWRVAEHNFEAALSAADGLVFDLALGLQDLEGMRADVVGRILDRAAGVYDRLLQRAEPNPRLLDSLVTMFMKFTDTYIRLGQLERAHEAAERAVSLMQDLAASDPSNATWQRNLSVSQGMVGDVLRAQGKLDEALEAYNASLAIRERLAAADPSNAGWQRDLSVSHQKIGFVAEQRGENNEARTNYMLSRDILLRLVAQDDSNATWRNDLAWVEKRLGALKNQVSIP
jgi:tetratricopeptide (TPR) repeat protein